MKWHQVKLAVIVKYLPYRQLWKGFQSLKWDIKAWLSQSLTTEYNVVTVDVEVVADVLRQRRLPHRPGLVRAGGKVLTDLEDPVVEFYNLLSRVFLKMDSTLLEIWKNKRTLN